MKEKVLKFHEKCLTMSNIKFTFYILLLSFITMIITLPLDSIFGYSMTNPFMEIIQEDLKKENIEEMNKVESKDLDNEKEVVLNKMKEKGILDKDDNLKKSYLIIPMFLLFLYLVIFTPYIETILIHGIILGLYFKNRKIDNLKMDIIVALIPGVIFGVLHGINYTSLTKGVSFFIIGVLYSYAFFRARSLNQKGRWAIFKIHALNNFVAYFLILMSVLFVVSML